MLQLHMASNYLDTDTGDDSWDLKLRTPPRPRQDNLERQKLLEDLSNTEALLRQIEIDRKTCTGPLTYAGLTPKRLLKRKRTDAEQKKLLEANLENEKTEDNVRHRKKKRISVAGKLKWYIHATQTATFISK